MNTPTEGNKINLFDSTMLVAGSMIGSGIFIVSADMVRQVGSSGWLLFAWAFTALLTLLCAISYGELSALFPNAGGQYVYLREAFGKLAGWLYGWGLFSVIQTGTIAAVAVAFTKFAAYFFPVLNLQDEHIILSLGIVKIQWAHLMGILLILLITWINSRGVRNGALIQRIFTVTKISALLIIILLGFALGSRPEIWQMNWQNAWTLRPLGSTATIPWTQQAGLLSAALVGSLFSSDAWNNITFIAGEVKNPKRNVGLSLLIGTGTVLVLYFLMNVMYLQVLTLPEIASAPNDRVAVAVSEKLLGANGTRFLAALIMVSTFGCLNGMILAGARVYQTMAKDAMFFKQAVAINRFEVPGNALWIQAIWASLLCLSGKYGDLLDYIVFAVLVFYILTLLALIKLRIQKPFLVRPYKVWAYPATPVLYIVLASLISLLLLIYKPMYTWPGLIIISLGVPVYYLVIRKRGQEV